MFKDTDANAVIERAYDIQGDRIAYVEKSEMEQDKKLVESVREEHERYN